MSNLLKYNSFVVNDGNNIVIDSNQKVLDKINSIRKNIKTVGLSNQGKPDEDGFVSGLNAQVVEELVAPEEEAAALEDAKAEAQEILSAARNEAEGIIGQAHRDAENFINAAKEQGYADGMKAAAAEAEEHVRSLDEEFSRRKQELAEEYDNKVAQIEPMLVDTFIRVFSKVTHIMAEDKKDMIICLINSVMHNAELSREFYIRVSPEDYRFAVDNQNMIYTAVAKDIHIDISEDVTLGRNQCIIETDAGVFDCSLDVQLDNLIKDIKLLSCMI